jgi:hypothetical protein
VSKRPPRYGETVEKLQNTLLVDGNALFKTGFFCLSLISLIFICKETHMGKKLNTEDFIAKANIIHDNKFSYNNDYKGSKIDIGIECPIHGLFYQKPNDHLKGDGCSKCSGKYKPTTNEFIKRSNEIHGNKYDYSLCEYINVKTKVKIICTKHGEFEQIPDNHINLKQGCPKCGYKQNSTTKDFISKAKLIHGNKYYYPDEYICSKDKINVGCYKHGLFKQTPHSHLRGNGCKNCRAPLISEFIEKAKIVHGNLYDYSKVVYIDSKTKIDINCHKHGIFKQKMNDHLYGNGCPICKESKGEVEIRKLLTNKGIDFKRQKTYSDCRYVRPLPFDIFIPSINAWNEDIKR